MIDGWFGRSPWRQERPTKAVPGWIAAVGMLAAFGGGLWCGGKLGVGTSTGSSTELRAPGEQPGFVGENPLPLTKTAVFAAVYQKLPAADAKAQAQALSTYLQDKGLKNARPYLFPTEKAGPMWVVAVYYDGEAELKATCNLMRALPADVPDETFVALRRAQESGERGWPRAYDIR